MNKKQYEYIVKREEASTLLSFLKKKPFTMKKFTIKDNLFIVKGTFNNKNGKPTFTI